MERVFRNNNGKIEDAIECLGALPSIDIHGRDKSQSTESAEIGNCDQNQASCKSCSSILLAQLAFTYMFSLEIVCVLDLGLRLLCFL